MTYYDSLLNPEWITKRKKILQRDGYKCTVCGSKSQLCVHHTYYYKRRVEPWEYPSRSLLTLCERCHTDWHIHHEIVYKNNPKIKIKKRVIQKRLTDLEKMTLKYWEVETTSRSGKSLGVNCFYARDKKHVMAIMKKKRLPVFHIKRIK